MRISALILAGLALGVTASSAGADTPPAPESPQTLERLRGNQGITLQWIGWDQRGDVQVRTVGGRTFLTGWQVDPGGAGTLWIDGEVVESGDDHFILDGLIRIAGSPDAGRNCAQDKRWTFAITQNRRYYRLREFEWCDGLTDYIDIYF